MFVCKMNIPLTGVSMLMVKGAIYRYFHIRSEIHTKERLRLKY